MKKRWIPLMLACALLAGVLAGCAKNGDDSSLPQSAVSEVPVVSELELNIAKYEALVETEPTPENYLALAGYYSEAGKIKMQRDALERCYRLNGDDASLAQLETIVVNAAEENTLVQEQAKQLADNLSIEEYQQEALAQMMDPQWLPVMMPKLETGKRSYYYEMPEGKGLLCWEVGYQSAAPYSRAWLLNPEGTQATILSQEGVAAQLITTGMENGKANGAFTAWLFLSTDGAVYQDSGTFKENILTGDFTSAVHSGLGETDLYTLVANRSTLEAVPYTGSFGEDGTTAVEQPAKIEAGLVAYAFNEDKSNYLYVPQGEGGDVASTVFNTSFFGLPDLPAFNQYAPVAAETPGEVTLDPAAVEVRVYDGDIQWFDGTRWHTLGPVGEYTTADPFAPDKLPELPQGDASGEQQGEIPQEELAEDAKQNPDAWYARRGSAAAKPAEKASSSSSAASKAKPPAASKAPPAPAAPAPTPPANNGGGGGGGGGQATPPATTPPPDPAPTPPPTTGGDGQDIEWTGDQM